MKIRYLLFLVILVNTNVFSQSTTTDGLASLLSGLEDISGGLSQEPIREGSFEIDSFNQAEYSNVVKQLSDVQKIDVEEDYQTEAQRERISLAFQLCMQDEKACELLENYRKSKSLKKINPDSLSVFGIDLFVGYPISFDQTDLSGAARDYRLNIGDEIEVQVIGVKSVSSRSQVDSEGFISVYGISKIFVLGLNIDEAREQISNEINSLYPGSKISTTLLSVNTIQVYALGLVNKPGAYQLAAASKSINGIIASGGFQENASLRDIKVNRGDETFNIDLYDFLILGKSDSDLYLQNGDSLLINARKNSIELSGEVNRPAIYEFREGESIQDAIEFALGFSEVADRNNISLARRNNKGIYKTINIDANSKILIENGDKLNVGSLDGDSINKISLLGEIRNRGDYEFSDDLTLGKIINIETDLKQSTYTGLTIIKRFNYVTRSHTYLVADLISQQRLDGLKLKEGDQIFILSKNDIDFLNSGVILNFLSSATSKTFYVENKENYKDFSCLESLNKFGNSDFIKASLLKLKLYKYENFVGCSDLFAGNPSLLPIALNYSVPVFGMVVNPGVYPISKDVTGGEVITLSGGYLNESFKELVTQFGYSDSTGTQVTNNSEVQDIIFAGITGESLAREESYVDIYGEVKFVGRYKIDESTTLLDVINEAGGYLPSAFPHGGILTRESLREREAEMLKKAERELANILASGVTSGIIEQSGTDLLGLITLIREIGAAEPSGRLVAEFNLSKLNNPSNNVLLKPGDSIFIPSVSNTVTVIGSVLNPVTIPYSPKNSVKDYIKFAGGASNGADIDSTYVLFADGSSTRASSLTSFGFNRAYITPGSTIIVPRSARPLSGLSLVEAITPILANLSITMASINSITNN